MVLDTGIWFRWVSSAPDLAPAIARRIDGGVSDGEPLLVCAISTWEVSKLVEKKRIDLHEDLDLWVAAALDPSGIGLLPLTPEVAIFSTRLPGEFHRDPADQMIVATTILTGDVVVTTDGPILAYPHVRSFSLDGPGAGGA